MIGFNAGLIGIERRSNLESAPGAWTSSEQYQAILGRRWPNNTLKLGVSTVPSIIRIDINGVQVAINNENFISVLNTSAFQSRVAFSGSSFRMQGAIGNKFNFQWYGLDLSETPLMYVRYQRVATTNVSLRMVGNFVGSPIASTATLTNAEVTYTFSSSTGSGSIEILNSNPGLLVHNIAFGGGSAGNVIKNWKLNAASDLNGLQGGLIGPERAPSIAAAPGVWLLDEQLTQKRKNAWPA